MSHLIEDGNDQLAAMWVHKKVGVYTYRWDSYNLKGAHLILNFWNTPYHGIENSPTSHSTTSEAGY